PLAPTTSLFFTPSLAPPDRHSFPTRRSSDLPCRPTPDGRGHLSRKPVRPAMPASIGVKSVGTAVAGRPRGTSDARRTSAPPAEPIRRPAAGLVRVLVRVVVDLLGDVAVDVDVAVAQEVVEPEAAEEVDEPAALVLVLAAADVGDYAVDVFDLVLGVFLGLGRARQPNAC